MKILQLNLEKGWRGGERQTLFCMREFRRHGHEVQLAARQDQALAKHAQAEGFHVHTFRKPYQLFFWLVRHAREFDIIHCQTANSLSWAALAKPFLKSKLVFTRRTAFPVKPEKEQRTRYKWRKVDLFISICEAGAIEPRRLGISSIIIPSAIQSYEVNQQRAQALKNTLPDLKDKYLIGTTSALTREKDPITMIKAIAELKARGLPVVFLHFGQFGDMHTACIDAIQELNLNNEYLLLGFHQQVEDYLSLLDVFTMSSTFEALGSSVLDAFWQKVPVVSTDAGGLKDILADGRGILCAVGDSHAIAEGIEAVLSQPDLRSSMCEKGYNYVKEHHLVGPMGQAYLAAFNKLLNTQASQ